MREINGIKVAHNATDWQGRQVGRLKVVELIGKHKTRKALVWRAECSCGNSCEVTSSELAAQDTKSCGCLKSEHAAKLTENSTTHGMGNTAEYRAWKRMKGRCTNPNSKEYAAYSQIGICDEFSASFQSFYEDIGPIPADFRGRPSVDRKDNTKGYIKGNVRWANDTMQARNKGKYKNNSSGVSGVYRHISKSGKMFWAANWYNLERKQRTRYFSIEKYGDELALFAACELRSLMVERLNMQGAGYTDKHGL